MKPILMCLMVLAWAGMAAGDWNVGDSYKMHYPQLPKTGGFDVEFAASTLADDWRCTGTGAVSDIHFWISWMNNQVGTVLPQLHIQIFSDIPDPDGAGPLYSQPGTKLWDSVNSAYQVNVRDMALDPQGWYDPSQTGPASWGLNDHDRWQQVNITNIVNPFIQQENTIYWLAIDFGTKPFIGWKESGSLHFNDDAVWLNQQGQWVDLHDPITQLSMDLAFVITPEPASLLLLASGVVLLRRKK